MAKPTKSRMTIAEFERLVEEKLPLVQRLGIRAERIDAGRAVLRMPRNDELLRSGGTVNGPAMVALADTAMYAVVMSLVGPVEAVATANLNANFLRRPKAADMIAEARILKIGNRLAVGEASLYTDGEAEPVCHVTATYSIPPHHGP